MAHIHFYCVLAHVSGHGEDFLSHTHDQHSTAQPSTALRSPAQHCTAQHSTAQHSVVCSQGNCVLQGGETLALKRMEEHIADKAWVVQFEKPKGNPAALEPATTVLSPYLKFGCLSVRVFYKRLQEVSCPNFLL